MKLNLTFLQANMLEAQVDRVLSEIALGGTAKKELLKVKKKLMILIYKYRNDIERK